jgi:hypothetical protein
MAEFLLMLLEQFVKIFAGIWKSQTARPTAFNTGAEASKAKGEED